MTRHISVTTSGHDNIEGKRYSPVVSYVLFSFAREKLVLEVPQIGGAFLFLKVVLRNFLDLNELKDIGKISSDVIWTANYY